MNRQHASGMTMVEVLIALLIISIGLLGVAALHASTLRNNYDALMRSHASALAADIADRMRANRTAALGTDDYEIALTDTDIDIGEDPTVAAIDISEWRASLAAQLPGGTGAVAIDPDTRIVTITIQWGEREDDPVTFVTETEI
jgi:type IV pilus assembly protein PilV